MWRNDAGGSIGCEWGNVGRAGSCTFCPIFFLCDYTHGDRHPIQKIHSTVGRPHRFTVDGSRGYSLSGEEIASRGIRTIAHVDDFLGNTKSENSST